VVILRVRLLVKEVNAKPPSHDDNDATKETWPRCDIDDESYWRWRCRGDVGRSAMSIPSHAGDVATEVMLAIARYRCRVMLAMLLPW
jgi:hypothetical protein